MYLARILLSNIFLTSLFTFSSAAQDTSLLEPVTVNAFEREQLLIKVAAAVAKAGITNASNTSLVDVVNSVPGARLEERSPGSYRVNIRASSLRSPFGVRNVKVYLNDLPFTEPGGHSYFNQLGYYNVASLEIIRGPASGIYGAGTGGVMLIKTLAGQPRGIFAEYSAASYASHNVYIRSISGAGSATHLVGYQHQQSNGYRDHSEMKRQVFNYTAHFPLEKGSVHGTLLYGNLGYETPGALNFQQYQDDPRAARPGTAVFPSAEAARAAVKQQMIFAGAGMNLELSPRLKNRTGLYGMYTTLRNPNIQGYDKSEEPHYGIRSVFSYQQGKFEVQSGIEYQDGNPGISSFTNNNGKPGELRSIDKVKNSRLMVFLQASYTLDKWTVSLAGSYNALNVEAERIAGAGQSLPRIRFRDYAPRIALLRDLGKFSIYAGYSGGFSPPTTQEILPSGGEINPSLEAEAGNNFELGSRGSAGRFLWDVNLFSYRLRNSIVQRRTAGGGDHYINAGSTKQPGAEIQAGYNIHNGILHKGSRLKLAYTYYDFRYQEFVRIDEDFSGKSIPSVPKHAVNALMELVHKDLNLILNYEYLHRIALNDANTAFANAANIYGLRLGWARGSQKSPSVFFAIANIFNEKYSLGNDYNGFGGRYYNAAPGRNYSAGVSFTMPWQ